MHRTPRCDEICYNLRFNLNFADYFLIKRKKKKTITVGTLQLDKSEK